jgi:hypothetical protein
VAKGSEHASVQAWWRAAATTLPVPFLHVVPFCCPKTLLASAYRRDPLAGPKARRLPAWIAQ